MSNLHIPCTMPLSDGRNTPNGEVQIDAHTARQIVALAQTAESPPSPYGLPGEPWPSMWLVNELARRLSRLEQSYLSHQHQITVTDRTDAGPNSCPIQKPPTEQQDAKPCAHPAPVDVCALCGGTYEECQSRRCYGYVNGQRNPAKPAADEAAEAIKRVRFMTSAGQSMLFPYYRPEDTDNAARAILAAIRAGKVPGIWCGELAENIASTQLVAALRDELKLERGINFNLKTDLENARRENEALKAEVDRWNRADAALRKHGIEVYHDDKRPAGEQDVVIVAEAVKVKAGRDRLAARVSELERENAEAQVNGLRLSGQCQNALDARDKALAELAAERLHRTQQGTGQGHGSPRTRRGKGRRK